MTEFRAPQLARPRPPREFEFPPGSGRRATYSAEEQAFVLALARCGSPTAESELRLLHEFKVEFGAVLA